MTNPNIEIGELIKWYKVLNYQSMRNALLEALDDQPKRVVYQLTSPDRSSKELSQISKDLVFQVASSTIRLWHSNWVMAHIVRQVSPLRKERIFDLREFGIPLPKELDKFV